MLDVKINHLRIALQKSDNLFDSDMLMIRMQALEWVQVQIQDLILNNPSMMTNKYSCHQSCFVISVNIVI